MEQGNFPEQLPQSAEQETQSQEGFEALAGKLGFIETAELGQLRSALIEANERGDEEAIRLLTEQYQTQGEAIVDQQQGSAYAAAQIGLIIATATLRRDIGKVDLALEDLKNAAEYAENMGMDEVAAELLASSEIADALAPFEDDGLDPETRAEIAVLPFDEAFETAYGYLMQAGLDADEILAPFTEQ
ncbi:hypothetical protein RAAC3_TM7C00001G0088 [Candidatus Saccharibacteria bacterium RAAC3_TM7_1]|nr:hypothetical protein RAAC3_TM7C00001G0088 [Candidatus Saccharibacteria bacterium RAAC3_TM7_1]HCZ28219.1 hypothetical protein [Candidatus Saccharibacteria bacterium]